jgi:hypothetical protein
MVHLSSVQELLIMLTFVCVINKYVKERFVPIFILSKCSPQQKYQENKQLKTDPS